MYAILSGGALVALCDKPRYVKKNDNNIYVEAAPAEAIGVSVGGVLYNINGGDAIPGRPAAIVTQRDSGEVVFQHGIKIAANGAAIIATEDALCELDAANDAKMAAMEDALCELDGVLSEVKCNE